MLGGELLANLTFLIIHNSYFNEIWILLRFESEEGIKFSGI